MSESEGERTMRVNTLRLKVKKLIIEPETIRIIRHQEREVVEVEGGEEEEELE